MPEKFTVVGMPVAVEVELDELEPPPPPPPPGEEPPVPPVPVPVPVVGQPEEGQTWAVIKTLVEVLTSKARTTPRTAKNVAKTSIVMAMVRLCLIDIASAHA